VVLLHKPFTEDALIRKVREVLDTKSADIVEPRTEQITSKDRANPR
jgi:hypothetical protein